jgi:hypothetical protein
MHWQEQRKHAALFELPMGRASLTSAPGAINNSAR